MVAILTVLSQLVFFGVGCLFPDHTSAEACVQVIKARKGAYEESRVCHATKKAGTKKRGAANEAGCINHPKPQRSCPACELIFELKRPAGMLKS